MEEYLVNMKHLRSQMNDFEEEVTHISAEEQKLASAVQNLEKEIEIAKSETRQVKEHSDGMVKGKNSVSIMILDKKRELGILEFQASSYLLTLELMQQEKDNLAAKLEEKRSYYMTIIKQMKDGLETLQVEEKAVMLHNQKRGVHDSVNHTFKEYEVFGEEKNEDLMNQLKAAETELKEIEVQKSRFASENIELNKKLEELQRRANDFPPTLKAMETIDLEEEIKALTCDKAGETEYRQSLHDRIMQLKGISEMVKCQCGEEYMVEMIMKISITKKWNFGRCIAS